MQETEVREGVEWERYWGSAVERKVRGQRNRGMNRNGETERVRAMDIKREEEEEGRERVMGEKVGHGRRKKEKSE